MRLHQELERFHPMFGRFSNQYRVMVMPHFFLALGAGLFLGGLGKGKRTSALIGAAAAAVFAAESVWTSAAPVPAAAHPILMNETQMELDRSPEEFAVFDLPIAFEKPMLHRYIAGQFFHRRPIVYSDFPTRRVAMTPALLKGELLVALLAQAGPAGEAPDDSFSPAFLGLSNAHEGREAYFQGVAPDDRVEPLVACLLDGAPCAPELLRSLDDSLRRLEKMRLTRFVVHDALVDPDAPLHRVCEKLFGPPAMTGNGLTVFILGPGAGNLVND